MGGPFMLCFCNQCSHYHPLVPDEHSQAVVLRCFTHEERFPVGSRAFEVLPGKYILFDPTRPLADVSAETTTRYEQERDVAHVLRVADELLRKGKQTCTI